MEELVMHLDRILIGISVITTLLVVVVLFVLVVLICLKYPKPLYAAIVLALLSLAYIIGTIVQNIGGDPWVK